MATHDVFGWRDRAITLASLGAAALSRFAFTRADAADAVDPLEMQVLLALALENSLAADPRRRTGTDSLSLTLRLEQAIVEEIVTRLESRNLVRCSSDARAEGELEFDEEGDEDVTAEVSIGLTDPELEMVDRWLRRTRPHFGGWAASAGGCRRRCGLTPGPRRRSRTVARGRRSVRAIGCSYGLDRARSRFDRRSSVVQ